MLSEPVVNEECLGLANGCSETKLEPRAAGYEARVEAKELSIASSALQQLNPIATSQRVEETTGLEGVLFDQGASKGIAYRGRTD